MAEVPTKPIQGDAILPWAERITDAVKWARKPDGWRPRAESYRNRFPFQVEMGINTYGTPAQSVLWVRGGYWLHITDLEAGTHVLAALQAGNIDNTESVDVSAEEAGTLQLWVKLDFTASPAITIETAKVEAENVYWKLLAECTLANISGTSVVASKIQQRWRGGDIGPTISGAAAAAEHNELDGLQGGDPATNSYYHLSEAEYQDLIDGGYIDPVPTTCDQNEHPGDDDFDGDPGGTDDTHPGDSWGGDDGTNPDDDPDGYDSHPGADDCYTTIPD